MSQSAGSKSQGANRAQRRRNSIASTTSGQMPKTSTANSRPPPSPMTMQTRRSSLRSSTSAEVTPTSESRLKMQADMKPLMGSPVRLGAGASAHACLARSSVVPLLAQHIRQSVKFWSSKSTAVEAASVMMTSQPRCSDIVDAVLQVLTTIR